MLRPVGVIKLMLQLYYIYNFSMYDKMRSTKYRRVKNSIHVDLNASLLNILYLIIALQTKTLLCVYLYL